MRKSKRCRFIPIVNECGQVVINCNIISKTQEEGALNV